MAGSKVFETGALPWGEDVAEANKQAILGMFNEAKQEVQGWSDTDVIDNLKNMENAPISVNLGKQDLICRPEFSQWHKNFCDYAEAKCSINFFDGGHEGKKPVENPHTHLDYLFTNLGGEKLAPSNSDWLTDASFRKFDQQEFIDLAADEYKKISGNADTVVDF